MANINDKIIRKCSFDPSEYFIKIDSMSGDGSVQNYLEVKYRILWFNTYCAENGINGVIDDSEYEYCSDAKMFIATCSVYMDGKLVGKASAGQQYDGSNGDTIIQSATTAAKGRALANAGFGTAMCGAEDKESTPCESGIPTNDTNTKQNINPLMAVPEQSEVSMNTRIPPKQAGQAEETGQDKIPKTLLEAQAYIAVTGQYKGITMGEIFAINPGYITFCANKMNEARNPGMVAAAKLITANAA